MEAFISSMISAGDMANRPPHILLDSLDTLGSLSLIAEKVG
jgi:hypothetical protein